MPAETSSCSLPEADRPAHFRVLLFGDSNIWGYDPQSGLQQPDRASVRLGQMHPDWELTVSGQNGRSFSSRDPLSAEDGSRQIGPLLRRFQSLDAVIIALGANDARRMNCQSAQAWQASMELFLHALQDALYGLQERDGKVPPVLLVSPPLIPDCALSAMDCRIFYGESGQSILKAAQSITEKMARRYGMQVLRADAIGLYGGCTDGIHLDADGHRILAEGISAAVEQMIKQTAVPESLPHGRKEGYL